MFAAVMSARRDEDPEEDPIIEDTEPEVNDPEPEPEPETIEPELINMAAEPAEDVTTFKGSE